MAGAAAPLALALVAAFGVLDAEAMMAVVVSYAAVASVLGLLVAWLRNPWPRRARVAVRVEGDTVVLGDERHPRASLRGAYVVPGEERARVVFERAAPATNVEVEVDSEVEAHELLRELGLAPEQAVGRFVGMSRLQAHPRVALAVAALGVPLVFVLTALALFYVSPYLAAAIFLPGMGLIGAIGSSGIRIDVGADGVLLRWLGSERFLPFAQVTSVALRENGSGKLRAAILTLASGEEVIVPIAAAGYDNGRAQAIVARIEAARAAAGSGEAEPTAFLRRNDEAHGDWVRRLRASLELASPRRAAPSPERLWRIVEDAAQSPVARLAAAVALGPLDRAGKARIDSVARATAAPRLRIALETIDEDDATAEALAALEDERA
jgi:hypothetical protein